MCGIIGAIAQRNVVNILLNGLSHLEYRGYDSAGLAVIDKDRQLIRLRRMGKVQILKAAVEKHSLSGNIGIAHTRWATHGKPSENNTHPHISKNVVVVHNGIIENYELLRKKLQDKDYVFVSETDTEVIAHIIHWEMITRGGTLREVILRVIPQLKGTYSTVVMDAKNPNILIAIRSGSPLVIGLGIEENFVASDKLALLPFTNRFIFLEEGDIAEIIRCSISIFDKSGTQIIRQYVEQYNHQHYTLNKSIYNHYMQKEIYEQPNAIKDTISEHISQGRINLSELGTKADKIFSQIEHIQIVACGTSYNSSVVSRYWIEDLIGIPCDVEIASEFRYRKFALHRNSLIIAISQSGETADTLAAMHLAKKLGFLSSLAICNVPESSLVRESDLVLITKAGKEIGVASTKTFTTQLTIMLMLVAKIARLKNINKDIEYEIIDSLQTLPNNINKILSKDKCIKKIAKNFADKHHALFLARGSQYPIALEGALKLKEISYIHAEAYAAGELKHGPLALIDNNMPVIILAPKNKLIKKLKSNIEEVRARDGQIYIFTDQESIFTNFKDDDNTYIINMPSVKDITAPILYTIPLQLLAYYVAIIKGTDIDYPRNLAKSVTVE